MKFAISRVKRPVPPGAIDLGLTEDKYILRCSQCNATYTVFPSDWQKCTICNAYLFEISKIRSSVYETEEGVGYIPIIKREKRFGQGQSTHFDYYCNKCEPILCGYCSKPIIDIINIYGCDNDYSGTPRWRHLECLLKLQNVIKEEEQKKKEEEQRLEAVRILQEEQKLQMRREREASGLCLECGKPLSWLDKVQKIHTHSKCIQKR